MPGASSAVVTALVYHPSGDTARRYAALVRAPRRLNLQVACTRETAAPLIAEADVLYAWNFPRALYVNARHLQWIQAMGAGVDWVFGPELPEHVTVTRAPGVFGPYLAEYALGWCGWVTQRMATYRRAQRQRQWTEDVIPDRLRGKTLTILGLGDIGRAVARLARAFGMHVVGVNRSGRRVPAVDRVYRRQALERALGEADFVVVVLPLTPETRGLIGARQLAVMKPSAWLINGGRGAVLDEGALLSALTERRLAGAILDVFTTEPLPPEHPFWALDNVVVTPHIAGPSIPEEISPIFHDNLARFLARRPLRHTVNRVRGY